MALYSRAVKVSAQFSCCFDTVITGGREASLWPSIGPLLKPPRKDRSLPFLLGSAQLMRRRKLAIAQRH